jgi:hypothetical protein
VCAAGVCTAAEADKLAWLTAKLPGFIDEGDVLLFVGQRAKCEEVTAALHAACFKAAAIHGDLDQVGFRVWQMGFGYDRMVQKIQASVELLAGAFCKTAVDSSVVCSMRQAGCRSGPLLTAAHVLLA